MTPARCANCVAPSWMAKKPSRPDARLRGAAITRLDASDKKPRFYPGQGPVYACCRRGREEYYDHAIADRAAAATAHGARRYPAQPHPEFPADARGPPQRKTEK